MLFRSETGVWHQDIQQWGWTSEMSPAMKVGGDYKQTQLQLDFKVDETGNQKEKEDEVSLFSEWQVNRQLNTKVTGAASRHLDEIDPQRNSYYLSPRLDVRYQATPQWRLSSYVVWTRSVSGEERRGIKLSFRTRYDLNLEQVGDVHFSLQVDIEKESVPQQFEIWDILAQMNMVF